MGNLIARKKAMEKGYDSCTYGSNRLMVTDIDEKGFLRFTNIGGYHHILLWVKK